MARVIICLDLFGLGLTSHLSGSIQIIFPQNSLPQRPALPAKFQKSLALSGFPFPLRGLRIIIDFAGKFTPSNKVDVQIK